MDGHNEHQSTSRDESQDLIDRIPTHFLVELTSLDELAFPANSTKRVKYTCVASTSKSLCLGTSTGTVYIFSRYAAKSRSRTSSPVPVQVFTTRDGQISTISISGSEELMAIGGDSGRVSVAQMNNGHPPTLLYSTPGDARSPDKVTALAWSADLKTVYSGHSSGSIHCHRLTTRSVFRAAHQKLTKLDAEIVQLDILVDHLLASTLLTAHLVHVDSATSQQVGKKARQSPASLGALFVAPVDGESGSAYLIAARPNGRLWEANLVGVVYRTHQYRQNARMPRSPPISFRTQFPTDPNQFDGIHPENQDVTLNLLNLLRVDDRFFIVSAFGSRICIVETDNSRVVCVAELENEILSVSTCGNDVFVLLADSKGLRKFSVFERIKTIEKLNLKSFFLQAAQTILFCSHPRITFPTPLIQKTVEGLAAMSKKKETERLQQSLQRVLDDRHASQSMYDNCSSETPKREDVSRKLPSGVHRVLQTGQCSGYDDDFSFATPQALRERSRSSPAAPDSPLSPTSMAKRASEPSNLELQQEWRKNGTPDVAEEDILHRARQILDSSDGKFMEKESLRTLLQLEGVKRDEIRFTPTVTIGNAAKALAELALAVPVDLSTIWNRELPPEEPQKPKKPTIVKVVRPGIRPAKKKPVATVSPQKNSDEEANQVVPPLTTSPEVQISDEMRRKQDEMWLDLRLSHIKKQSLASPLSPPSSEAQTSRSEAVPKSDTDYTLTTESGEPTPSTDVWRNPLEDSEDVQNPQNLQKTPTAAEPSFSCSTCGMHRSWAAAALLMSICAQADVLRDGFSTDGAIPATMDDWQRVIRHRAGIPDPEPTAICPRCEMSLSSVERVCNDGWRTMGAWVEEGTKPNVERIFERCVNTSKDKLRAIIGKKEDSQDVQRDSGAFGANLKTSGAIRKESGPSEAVTKDSELPEALEVPHLFQWLRATSLRTILALAVFCIGKKSVLHIIASDEQWIARRMSPTDWCAIVIMGARETGFKDVLAGKTILSVLESVGASGWVMARKPSPPAVKSVRRPSSTTGSPPINTITSWIVDTNGKCPICTLSIKMIVGGQDRGVVSYCCGHVYHKICLAGRFTIGCLACRVRARRAAVARTNSSANSSAAPSPIGSPVMSPRHQHHFVK